MYVVVGGERDQFEFLVLLDDGVAVVVVVAVVSDMMLLLIAVSAAPEVSLVELEVQVACCTEAWDGEEEEQE